MSEYLAAAAQRLGAPEELVARSARARAAAQGVDVETILAAWAGGEATPTAAAAPSAPAPAEPEAAEAPTAEAPTAEAPTAEAPTPAPAPTAVPAAAPAAVAVSPRPDAAPILDSRRQNAWLLLAGISAMVIFGALMSFIVPSMDGGDDRHVAFPPPLEALAEEGREIYLREGCWYCHTQQVRPVIADAGLGAVTERDSEALDAPQLTGLHRIGPDLSDYSEREGATVAAIVDFLKHPQVVRPESWQPSYAFLSDADLEAVAAYVMADKAVGPVEDQTGGDAGT